MYQSLKWLAAQRVEVRTVLDVGASDGRWSALCMEFYPQADYVLFEPQPVHAPRLAAFRASVTQNVLVVTAAVGGTVSRARFDATDPFGGVLAHSGNAGNMDVEVTTLDHCIREHSLNGPFLVKLDTHGIEKSILDNASDVLASASVLIIEAYNLRITDEALTFWELCTFLESRGFRPIDLVDVMHRVHDGCLWQMDVVFVRSDWPGFSHIRYY